MSGQDAWPLGVVAGVRDHPPSGISLVIDPHGLLDLPSDLGQVEIATDWRSLRAAYETSGRRRPAGLGRLVLHVQDPSVRSGRDLPWDIERGSRVVVAGFPGVRRWIPLWRDLGPEGRGRLTSLLALGRDPSPAEVVRAVFGASLPARDQTDEFAVVVRLRLGDGVPTDAWPLIRGLVTGPLAAALADDPPKAVVIQAAWSDWLANGAGSASAALLSRVGPSLAGLVAFGLLRPAVRTAEGLPAWTAIGATGVDPADRVISLLEQHPAVPSSATFEDWTRVAIWWGAVRAAMADASPISPELAAAAWEAWGDFDRAYGVWVRGSLGMLMTSSRAAPATVDRIAPFLARRMRAGMKKVCLIVMDGMGFAQWSLIRDALSLRVDDVHAVMAVAPTLTPFSRQAIFAGALPDTFEKTLANNSQERQHWQRFWAGEGVPEGLVRYANTSGASRGSVPPVEGVSVLGVAALAVDDLMHGASLLGDAEVAAGIRLWLKHGFLATLIERATTAGFEVWITADHGNLEAVAIDHLPQEGLLVDRHGERVRFYATRQLRDNARADGIAWDPPGLPQSTSLLFAAGRTAFIRGDDPAVVHGGLSLDEMIVPLVRVSL